VPKLVPEATPEQIPGIAIEQIVGVDDWLNLDAPVLEKTASDAADAKPKKPTYVPNTKTTSDSTDAPRRSVFDDDLPDLAALESAPAKQNNVTDIFQLEGLDDLVPSSQPAQSTPWPAQSTPPPQPKPVENNYRIICRTCGTPMFLKLDRVGKKVSCSDCHSTFVVPPPPAGWSPVKKKIELQDDGFDVPLSAPEVAQSANTLESQRTSANEYLDNARQSIDRTFGFLTDPTAVGQLVLYGFLFSGVFALAQFSKTKVDGGGFEGGGYLLVLFIFTAVVSTIVALPMLSAGLALLESVANHQRRVAEWPNFNVFDNMGEILVILFSLLGSLLPGMLVGGLIGRSGGAEWLMLTGMMGTCFLLFPILMLSMLDNGSPLQPFSGAVMTSIPQVPEAWGGYYLKTMSAFGSVMVLWFILLGRNPLLSAIAGFMVPWLLFFTCQQIGALADSIAEHLSFEFVPPDAKKDKDSEKEADDENK
jgi:hypothetical protein